MRKLSVHPIYALLCTALLTVAALTTAGTVSARQPGNNQPACSPLSFEVHVRADLETVSGSLCRQGEAAKKILLITSHGATYNRSYWDWQQHPSVYSFVRNVGSRRVSILNLDLLGSGESSHPPSGSLPIRAQASMLHQLVRTMRSRGFKKVILVGHSSGSGTITLEASTYGDVDGLVVTGMLHAQLVSELLIVPLSFYPATLDPAFAGMDLDLGYLTTQPGTRGNAFYNVGVANPEVIAYDEAHKDVVTTGQAAGFPGVFSDPRISQAVDAPVLSLVGAQDGFCGGSGCPNAADESANWSRAARLELHVIPQAGHDIHLHGNPYAKQEFGYVRKWLERRFR